MNKVDLVESSRLRRDIPAFRPGDQLKVHVKVREGQRERIQVFEGVVIARRGGGLRESFTVRKVSFGVGVERTFPLHAPSIAKLEVLRHGRVRRAKLYYLRELSGRRAKIDERRTRIPVAAMEPEPEPDALADLAEDETVSEPEAQGQETVETSEAPETSDGETPAVEPEPIPVEAAPAPREG